MLDEKIQMLKPDEAQEIARVKGRVERLVSWLRGTFLPNLIHFMAFMIIWVTCSKFVENRELIQHHAWWMLYGFF